MNNITKFSTMLCVRTIFNFLEANDISKTLINGFYKNSRIILTSVLTIIAACALKMLKNISDNREVKEICRLYDCVPAGAIRLSEKELEGLIKANKKYRKINLESNLVKSSKGNTFFVAQSLLEYNLCARLIALSDKNFSYECDKNRCAYRDLACLFIEDIGFEDMGNEGYYIPKLKTIVINTKDFEKIMKEKAINTYGKGTIVTAVYKEAFEKIKETVPEENLHVIGTTECRTYHVAHQKGVIDNSIYRYRY